ncbi:MAG: type II toxin-antitoxin system HicA family toxin [Alphaproteobacteria bacterium]|nr:type II toxin-antitoxin system HicA family toxin [Alphaproteobacteria bacterium]
MPKLPHRPTWKQVERALRQVGAQPLRQRGSHQIWRLPCGERFVTVAGKLKRRAPRHVVASLRRIVGEA